jgi:hypothetical protein
VSTVVALMTTWYAMKFDRSQLIRGTAPWPVRRRWRDEATNYEPGGRGFKSCRARQYSMGYELQVRSFRGLRDPCGTFYPQGRLARVRDAQHGARFLTIQD